MKKWKQITMIAGMAIALSFAAKANSKAAQVTGVKQIDASTTSVTLSCDADLAGKAEYYQVKISTDKVNYVERSERNTSVTGIDIDNLTAGKSYWVKVSAYEDYDYSTETFSGLVQSDSTPIEVVTAPDVPSGFATTQVGATTGTVKIQADKVAGANLYWTTEKYNYIDRIGTSTSNIITAKVSAGAGQRVWLRTYASRKAASTGFIATESSYSYDFEDFKTVSKATSTKNFGVTSYWSYSGEFRVSLANYGDIDGTQVQFVPVKGKKARTFTSTSNYVDIKNLTGTFYKYRVRTYVSCGKSKACSAWSSYRYFGSSKKCTVSSSKRKIKINWSKLAGVKDCVVYISSRENAGYQKVKTLSAKKRSITITKYKKKKLKKGATYYIKVVPRAKVGKKTVTSDVIKQGSVYISRYS